MDLPLVKYSRCTCEQSDNVKNQLPSLDDYNISKVTITHLPSPGSYINVDNTENFILNR